jgi:hypothetical protein
MKLLLLLVVLVLELTVVSAFLERKVSEEHREQRRVEGDVLYGVVTDPVELGGLGLMVKLEHCVLQLED